MSKKVEGAAVVLLRMNASSQEAGEQLGTALVRAAQSGGGEGVRLMVGAPAEVRCRASEIIE